MKVVHTKHRITIDNKMAKYIEDTEMSHYGALVESYVKECTGIKGMLKFAYILNENKLGVHGVELVEFERVLDCTVKYDMKLAWNVDDDVDSKNFINRISNYLANYIGMWCNTNVVKVDNN